MLARLAQLKILVPLILLAALVALIVTVSDLPGLIGHVLSIPPRVLAIVLGLAFVYLVFKTLQFRWFLAGLDIDPSWHQLVASLAVGEMALSIPAGVYAQNYVLKRVQGADFSFSAAATTAELIAEGGVAFLIAGIIGVPGNAWVRPAILVGLAAGIALVAVVAHLDLLRRLYALPIWNERWRPIALAVIEFIEGLGDLARVRIIAVAVLLAAAYLFSLVAGFWLVAQAVGVVGLSFLDATVAYLLALSIGFGVAEVSGLATMRAFGYSVETSLLAFLAFRLVWTVCVWLIGGTALIILRGELAAA